MARNEKRVPGLKFKGHTYRPGSVVPDMHGRDVKLFRFLGEGANSRVWLGRDNSTFERLAVKKILGDPDEVALAEAYVRRAMELRPTIDLLQEDMQAYLSKDIEDGTYLCSYAEGLTLAEERRILEFPERLRRGVGHTRRLIGIWQMLLRAGVTDRDLKLEHMTGNGAVLDIDTIETFAALDAGEDVGTKYLNGEPSVTGTPWYMPPEALLHDEKYHQTSYLFKVGVVGQAYLTGVPGEGGYRTPVRYRRARNGFDRDRVVLGRKYAEDSRALFNAEEWAGVQNYLDFLNEAHAYSPKDRPQSAEECYEILDQKRNISEA